METTYFQHREEEDDNKRITTKATITIKRVTTETKTTNDIQLHLHTLVKNCIKKS